jgi:DNA polymerase III gamma/tau subunit
MSKRQRGLLNQEREKIDESKEAAVEAAKKANDTFSTPPLLPLHTKCRPSTFDDLIGNSDTVNSLKSKLAQGTLHRSILLQGPSGCGKTTIARILKAALGCSDFDFVEINMGNIGGVATAREIIKNIKLRPMQGRCRIYLLDEVQQATRDFQNALLKPLEDTPPYAYFILCTTDPQKLLITIRNRCAAYEVGNLNDDQIAELMRRTAEEENKPIDSQVISDIIIAADGCPRQAMVILDQIIDLDPRRQRRAIKSFIGEAAATIELCQALLKCSPWAKVQDILKGIEDEPEKVRRAVIGYMAAVVINNEGDMRKSDRAEKVYRCFEKPFYDTLRPGLVFSCWRAVEGKDIPF